MEVTHSWEIHCDVKNLTENVGIYSKVRTSMSIEKIVGKLLKFTQKKRRIFDGMIKITSENNQTL